MNSTDGEGVIVLGGKVPVDLHTRFSVKAANQRMTRTDLLREVVARELGFSSFADYVHIAQREIENRSEPHAEPQPAH